MGVFGDHLSTATHLATGAKAYAQTNRADYHALHGNMPSVRDYIHSDAGRASARHSVGTGISKWLGSATSRNFRRGNFIMGTLMTFAGHALASHMSNLKNDQRIFTNVAKVRRGDPEVAHMSHNELREVAHHAERYGGHDHAAIHAGATGELTRRHESKGQERAHSRITQDKAIHEHRQGQREAAHVDRIRRLREVAGHTSTARVAEAQKLANIKKAVETVKTKGVQDRQKAIRATMKAQSPEGAAKRNAEHDARQKATRDHSYGRDEAKLTKKTKGGGYYTKVGGGTFYQSDKTAAGRKAKGAGAGRKRSV